MFNHSIPLITAIIATFFVAGVVKGVTGMGLPTIAMGVLGSLLSPVVAAGLLLVPSFITNIWQLLAGSQFRLLLRRLWSMMATIAFGTVIGSVMLAHLTTIYLGIALVIYATYTLLAKPFHVRADWEWWLSPVVGLFTGLATGATGVFVIPAVPYIQSLDLRRDDLVQALGLSFTVSTVALAMGLLWHGAAPVGNLLASALMVVPALFGMAAGQAIRTWISPQLFRRIFLLLLLLLGLEMTLHGLF